MQRHVNIKRCPELQVEGASPKVTSPGESQVFAGQDHPGTGPGDQQSLIVSRLSTIDMSEILEFRCSRWSYLIYCSIPEQAG